MTEHRHLMFAELIFARQEGTAERGSIPKILK